MPAIFLRLLQHEDKQTALHDAASQLRAARPDPNVYAVNADPFRQVPGSPFAYWVSERVLKLFSEFPSLNSEGREAWKGLITGYDFQWMRLFWEVPQDTHGRSPIGSSPSISGRLMTWPSGSTGSRARIERFSKGLRRGLRLGPRGNPSHRRRMSHES
jgi:hypothetical protein